MKKDYSILTKTGLEITNLTLAEAKKWAKENKDLVPIIDEHIFDGSDWELSGRFWHYLGNKLQEFK